MLYGGNVLAVGGFSFFSGNDFGGRRYYQNMAVNRHIFPEPPTRAEISRREKYRRPPWDFWRTLPATNSEPSLEGSL